MSADDHDNEDEGNESIADLLLYRGCCVDSAAVSFFTLWGVPNETGIITFIFKMGKQRQREIR